jgi:hypothetical protein
MLDERIDGVKILAPTNTQTLDLSPKFEWDVKPVSYGDLMLHLRAIVNLRDLEGNEAAQDISVINRPIRVKVNPLSLRPRPPVIRRFGILSLGQASES